MAADWNRDGVWWYQAPLPRRWHRCSVWSTGEVQPFLVIERCACGAVRMARENPWIEKNSRRKRG